jgi:hypothetical protein
MKELNISPTTKIYVRPPRGGIPRSLRRVVIDSLASNPTVRAAWVVEKTIPLVDQRPTLLLGILFDQELWHGLSLRRRQLLNQVLQGVKARLPSGLPLDAVALNRSQELYRSVVESGPPLLDNRRVL